LAEKDLKKKPAGARADDGEPARTARGEASEPPAEPPAEQADAEAEAEEEVEDGAPAAGGVPAPAFRQILININDPEEIRIAVVEDRRLEEIHFERKSEKKYLGNIYRGRVVNLEPAIQAAFVDIGIGRNGFLHASDVLPVYASATVIPFDSLSQKPSQRKRLRIQELLQKGQEVLVQISKDSIGAKGPSLTTYVSIPGQYLVLMPGVSRYGVSKRIQDIDERAKLRESLTRLEPPKGLGYIIRTAGQDRSAEELERDLSHLITTWQDIGRRVRETTAPAMIYEESDLLIRAMRDMFSKDLDEILIDDAEVARRAKEFLAETMPELTGRVKFYESAVPLFSKFGVEEEIDKIYNRRVPLPSGGYLVIQETEALVAVDVNSGRYRDEEDLEATALKTNLEAAREIARQLRLRDLGGVIVNDFIDMEEDRNRREVELTLKNALRRDRAKCWISKISRFGIIEMTRQRVRPSFERANYEPCKLCHGSGVIKTARSTGIKVLRQLRAGLAAKKREIAEVLVHPDVQSYLVNERRQQVMDLETEFSKSVRITADPSVAPDQVQIRYR
jgi:ribonuclease E